MSKPLRRSLRDLSAKIMAPLVSPLYAGVGSILLFHRVVDPPPRRAGWARDLEIPPDALDALVTRLRRRGHAFVSMDELREALLRRTPAAAKLVVMTFDDGYVDIHDVVTPLLASHNIPFTFYLATDFPDGRIVPWWYLIEHALTRGSRFTLEHRGEVRSYKLDTLEQRDAAFDDLAALFTATPYAGHRALAEALFGPAIVARAAVELFLRWEQVAAMAAHPLVTIGAHTVSHPILKDLPLAEARHEMIESRRLLEARLGRRVRHFAYPYGQPRQAGPREFELAKECGFDTAVTTRQANVFPAHASSLECLPRISCEMETDNELLMTGAISALVYRGRRVITV